jgi:RNA polymerase sigma-70 factor (ECF subfamily)
MSEAARAAEAAARAGWARLVALLATRGTKLADAEDFLAEAFAAALRTWPERGLPDRPEAWLLTAARRAQGHARRHGGVRLAAHPALRQLAEAEPDAPSIPDERLRLLFACAQTAVPEAMRAPLMLQVVLGLPAARIGPAFLMAPAAMGQALSRAKAAIEAARAPFALPDEADMTPRLSAVLAAIYAAYGVGWEDAVGTEAGGADLAEEALWLARLCAAMLPDAAEALGLLALILHCEARRAARRDSAGRFVPLATQDTALWDAAMISEADALLHRAAALGQLGRFQIEAAIQSAHAARHALGRTPWPQIAQLYAGLVAIAPSLGAVLGQAAAIAETDGAAAALARLDALDDTVVANHQPYWALRAHLLRALGQDPAEAFARAAGLAADPAVRVWLIAQATARSAQPDSV